MKERPIIFSPHSVQGILAGRKSQTRRVWKKQPIKIMTPTPQFKDTEPGDLFICPDLFPTDNGPVGWVICECTAIGNYHHMGSQAFVEKHSPYGLAGDRLWVKEPWAYFGGDEYLYQKHKPSLAFKATWFEDRCEWPQFAQSIGYIPGDKWRNAMFMPRWASRITLEIVAVRVERVQQISVEDCIAEGMHTNLRESEACGELVDQYHKVWDEINAKNGDGWEKNPWVWVIEFKRVEEGHA